jgi:hypothetical protein
VDDLFLRAMDRASRREGSAAARLPAPWLRWAERVVAAGRRAEALPACPAAAVRRAVALADAGRSPSRAAALWALLFDSWASARPATRGGAGRRFLRFGGPGGGLDLEVVQEAGHWVLRGTVDGPAGPLALRLEVGRGRATRVPVRAGGAFAARVPVASGRLALALVAGRRTVARTAPLAPRA